MKRPDFYKGIHPQLDCDIVSMREGNYMTLLEEQRDRLMAALRLHLGCMECGDDKDRELLQRIEGDS